MWYSGSGTSAANALWLLYDGKGSVAAVGSTGSSNTTVGINTYGPWGEAGPGNTGRFQYKGMPYLASAGLYHDRARDYVPSLGRFAQPDPIGYGDGMNFYAFAHNSPISGADPSGNDCIENYEDISLPSGDAYPADGIPSGGEIVLTAHHTCTGTGIPGDITSLGSFGGQGGGGPGGRGNPTPQNTACNATAAVAFVQAHQADAARLAAMNGNTTAEILGLSMAEVGPGGNTLSRVGNNYFSMEGSNLPYATGTARTSGGATFATYSSYYYSGLSFLSVYGSSLRGITNPTAFAQALVPGYNSGNSANGGTSGFVQNTASVINSTAARMGCP